MQLCTTIKKENLKMQKKLSNEQYRKMYACSDCGMNTSAMDNYYMVHNSLWDKYGVKHKILCFTCLEKRMGRKLKYSDFTDAPINIICNYVQRLKRRT